MKLKDYKGIPHPAKMNTDSWVVVGPPGSGKTHLIKKIGGYSGEVAIDITEKKWWHVEPLRHRPREIHFVLPFRGRKSSIPVYDESLKGKKKFPELDLGRIRLPQKKKFILAPNWQARFVFDFILPPPKWLYHARKKRLSSKDGSLVDMDLTLEWVTWQVNTYWSLARFFHDSDLQVMVRPFSTARPYSFPVLETIRRKKTKDSDAKLTPSTNWSKIGNVQCWMNQTCPSK